MTTTSEDYLNNIRLTIIDSILLTANIFTQKSINRSQLRTQQDLAARIITKNIEEQQVGELEVNNIDDQF